MVDGLPTQNEQQLLLAVLRLEKTDEGAYGVAIRDELESRTGRKLALGAIYTTLMRLEKKGFVTSRLDGAEPVRGGKAKRFFDVTPWGRQAVQEARREMDRLWAGLEPAPRTPRA